MPYPGFGVVDGNCVRVRVVSTYLSSFDGRSFRFVYPSVMTDLSIPSAEEIQDIAKSKGWSMRRLCHEAGVTHETFFRWRDGKNSIGVEKLQRIIDVLNRPAVE